MIARRVALSVGGEAVIRWADGRCPAAAYGFTVNMSIDERAEPTARRRFRRHVVDATLAAAWLILGALHLLFPDASLWQESSRRPLFTSPDTVAWLLMIALCAPLVFRSRFPTTAFFISWSALILLTVGDYMIGLMPFVAWILIYAVGARFDRRRAAAALAFMVLGVLVAWGTGYPGFDAASAARNAIMLYGCLLLGVWSAAARRNARARLELAEQRTIVAAQHAHAAVIEERLRLAQELHDIVAHSMSVIAVQASMGSAAFDAQPDQTRKALTNIERTSRETLSELRGLLGVLRRDDGSRATLSPMPSLHDVHTLVANVRSAGIAVTVDVDDSLVLPTGADAFAYRIVQEALTNVLKHAHASHVTIEVRDSLSVVTLCIRDDGRGASARQGDASSGHGITGMRERVAAFGGTLRVGPAPGGGFEVVASFPYASVEQAG
jgi:signal transduction histidine kinase